MIDTRFKVYHPGLNIPGYWWVMTTATMIKQVARVDESYDGERYVMLFGEDFGFDPYDFMFGPAVTL